MQEPEKSILGEIRIASPCEVSWQSMAQTENEAVRFCGQCTKNVYDISNMTTAQAELLLQSGAANSSGALPCLQLYRRHDGTIITDDCPVGMRRIRNFWRKVKTLAASITALLFVVLPASAQNKDKHPHMMERGRPSALPTKAAPTEILTPPGSPAPIDWRKMAMDKPAVKKLAERVEIMKKDNMSAPETIKLLRLQLEMAQEAEKNNVPYFAMEEMATVQNSLEKLADKNIQNERKALLKDVLKARIINAKKLKISDSALSEQLNKLTSDKF